MLTGFTISNIPSLRNFFACQSVQYIFSGLWQIHSLPVDTPVQCWKANDKVTTLLAVSFTWKSWIINKKIDWNPCSPYRLSYDEVNISWTNELIAVLVLIFCAWITVYSHQEKGCFESYLEETLQEGRMWIKTENLQISHIIFHNLHLYDIFY